MVKYIIILETYLPTSQPPMPALSTVPFAAIYNPRLTLMLSSTLRSSVHRFKNTTDSDVLSHHFQSCLVVIVAAAAAASTYSSQTLTQAVYLWCVGWELHQQCATEDWQDVLSLDNRTIPRRGIWSQHIAPALFPLTLHSTIWCHLKSVFQLAYLLQNNDSLFHLRSFIVFCALTTWLDLCNTSWAAANEQCAAPLCIVVGWVSQPSYLAKRHPSSSR